MSNVLLGGDMLFEWVWKNRTTTDEKMLGIMERMAKAAELQAKSVEASHQASIASAISAKDANEAAARKYAAEQELVEQEIERRKRFDAEVSSN